MKCTVMSAWLVLGAVLATSAAPPPAMAQNWLFEQHKNSVNDKLLVRFPKKYKPGDIIVSFGDRRLYHVTGRGRAMSYPIAVPRAESRWEGFERVTRKAVNPSWTPTASMRKENPDLPAFVPGGHPQNPMGVRALYLGNTLYRIHGTDAPWTIGDNVSKGCVRMHNEHVIELYNRVKIGTRVLATWDKLKAPPLHPTQADEEFANIFKSTR